MLIKANTPTITVERWTRLSKASAVVAAALLAALAFGPLLFGANATDRLTTLFIYIILSVMWNALAGYGGLVSVGQQAFFGLGAYAAVRLSDAGVAVFPALLLGSVLVGLAAVPLSSFMLRLKGGEFAIGMWVVAEAAHLFVNLDGLIQGETGTSLIALNAYNAETRRALTYWAALAAATGLIGVVFILLRSRAGAAIQAIRDDESAAAAVGVRVLSTKRTIFVLAAFGAALAGALWLSTAITFQPKTYFSVQWTAYMIFMALVGGLGTFEGAILGAVVFFALETFFGASGVWYLIGLGATALTFSLYLPRGIWGTVEDRFGIRLLPVGYRLKFSGAPAREFCGKTTPAGSAESHRDHELDSPPLEARAGREPRMTKEQTMKIEAAVARGASQPLSLETIDIEPPRTHEILVRLVATGVCHTDISARDQIVPVPLPVTLGHEGAGIVEKIGAAVTKVQPGDRVVMTFNSCGRCPSCNDHLPNYCYDFGLYNFAAMRTDGTSPLSKDGERINGNFFGQSSFASYSLCHETNVVKVPDGVPLELLGPLACGIQTGAGAVINALEIGMGQSLAVFGCGSVGLSAVMAAKLVGAGTIIAIDLNDARLALARELGAIHVINPLGQDPVEEIRRITGKSKGADFTFETTGNIKVLRQAIDALAPRGTCGLVGVSPAGSEVPVDVFNIMTAGRKIRGIVEGDSNPDVFIPRMIELYRQGRFPFDKLITFYPFEKINDAIHDSETGKVVKPVVRFGSGGPR